MAHGADAGLRRAEPSQLGGGMSIVFKTPLAAACALHDCTRDAPDWYAGVASEPAFRVFGQHRVDRARGHWAWVRCESAEVAHDAEAILLLAGYVGGLWEASPDAVFVYVYRMTDTSCETRGPSAP